MLSYLGRGYIFKKFDIFFRINKEIKFYIIYKICLNIMVLYLKFYFYYYLIIKKY